MLDVLEYVIETLWIGGVVLCLFEVYEGLRPEAERDELPGVAWTPESFKRRCSVGLDRQIKLINKIAGHIEERLNMVWAWSESDEPGITSHKHKTKMTKEWAEVTRIWQMRDQLRHWSNWTAA